MLEAKPALNADVPHAGLHPGSGPPVSLIGQRANVTSMEYAMRLRDRLSAWIVGLLIAGCAALSSLHSSDSL
jgi:hypothetical protein